MWKAVASTLAAPPQPPLVNAGHDLSLLDAAFRLPWKPDEEQSQAIWSAIDLAMDRHETRTELIAHVTVARKALTYLAGSPAVIRARTTKVRQMLRVLVATSMIERFGTDNDTAHTIENILAMHAGTPTSVLATEISELLKYPTAAGQISQLLIDRLRQRVGSNAAAIRTLSHALDWFRTEFPQIALGDAPSNPCSARPAWKVCAGLATGTDGT